MGVSWLVFPIVPEVTDWLQGKGHSLPTVASRWATLEEVIGVLESFGEPVQRDDTASNNGLIVALSFGELGAPLFAQILGRIDQEGYYRFSFEKGGNNDRMMVTILKRLAAHCGALVIIAEPRATCLIVTADTDVDAAVADWETRWRVDNPKKTST
jgi:hypothetical protein